MESRESLQASAEPARKISPISVESMSSMNMLENGNWGRTGEQAGEREARHPRGTGSLRVNLGSLDCLLVSLSSLLRPALSRSSLG